MGEKITAVIDEVIMDPSKIQPIIVKFQNGALKDEETSQMNCGIYHDTKKDKTVLAMSNGRMVYKGYRPDIDKDLTYTMLAIYNKRTGKMRLVQAERWQVAPVLDQDVTMDEGTDAGSKISILNKQFGSKKSKRRTEQYERMQINIDLVKEQLEQTVSNVEIDRADLTTKSSNADEPDDNNIPRCNRDASTVNDVYNLHDIIPTDIFKTLYDKIEEIEEHGTEGKSEFYVKTIVSIASSSERTKKVAILEYIEAVRTWLNSPFSAVKKRTPEVYCHSEDVNNHVIDTYSMLGAHGRQRPTSMRDKGIIHCMILALMIFNFELDLESFSTLFTNNRGVKKFSAFARIIGAMPAKDNKNRVVLKLPLPAPLNTMRKGKRK